MQLKIKKTVSCQVVDPVEDIVTKVKNSPLKSSMKTICTQIRKNTTVNIYCNNLQLYKAHHLSLQGDCNVQPWPVHVSRLHSASGTGNGLFLQLFLYGTLPPVYRGKHFPYSLGISRVIFTVAQ